MNAVVMSSFEWLGKEMRAKTACYDISVNSTGEKPPGWSEKAGAFAKMDSDLQKDVACILAFGDYRDSTPERKRVEDHLFQSIYAVADGEKKYKKEELPAICRKIARMELHFFLYDFLEEELKLKGRLRMGGLLDLMDVKTYQNKWKHYGDAVAMMLSEAKIEAEAHIDAYKKQLNAKFDK